MPTGVFERLTKPCATCGKEFRLKRAELERRKYCSYRCRNQKQWGLDCQEPNWSCAICGKQEHVTPFWVTRKKTCSWECRNVFLSRLRTGEGGTNWKGGAKHISRLVRGSKPMRHWAEGVIAAAEGKCAHCDAPATDAHHVIGVAELIAQMLDIANGLALCNGCHSQMPGHNTNFVRRPPA